MKKMNKLVVAVALACGTLAAAPVSAQVSFAVSTPGLSIGVNVPAYPQLVPVPGYPVYYAPQLNSNYFFYDGLYWVYSNDNWYASSWYNGPWSLVEPDVVPVFLLRVPVRYYRRPPTYFRAWSASAPPRWGEHWGNSWEDHRRGWDNWDRRAAPAPAPLPVYQRQYSGNRYPHWEQQRTLEVQNYRYTPRDPQVQQRFQAQAQPALAPSQTVQRAPQPSRAVNHAEPQAAPNAGQNQRQVARPAQAVPKPDYARPPTQQQAREPQPRPERQAQQPPPQQRQAQPRPPDQQPRQAQQPRPERQAQQPQPQRQAQPPQPKPEWQAQQPRPVPPPQAQQQAQRQQVAQQQHEQQPSPGRGGEQGKGEGKGKGQGQDGH